MAVPAGSALRTRHSSSRRPPPARASWGSRSPHWSLRKLVGYLANNPRRIVRIGRERTRRLLGGHEISFQRTRTWKESPEPEREAKLARIEEVLEHQADRAFAFDGFGPLTIQPVPGVGWSPQGRPHRLPANYHNTAWVRYIHGCYSIGEDQLWGVVRAHKGAVNTLAALRSIRAARPDGDPIYVILDNLLAHKGPTIRAWAARHAVDLDFTPTYASWADPIEPHLGSLRSFVIAGSNHSNHSNHGALTRALRAHLRWRNAHAHHPDVLAAQRRQRARIRSERHRRWGQPQQRTAA